MTWYPARVRRQALTLIRAANTLAGPNVWSNRDTPLAEGELPAVVVYLPTEKKSELGAASQTPGFAAILSLHLELRVDGANLNQVEIDLETLIDQVQDALLTNPAFTKTAEHISECSVEASITAQADQHIGRALITMSMHYSVLFEPVIPDTLETVGLQVDTGWPFDPTGQYNPAYPAPRTSGPDGRIEAATTLTLPQE